MAVTRRDGELSPARAERSGAHGHEGKRVREDVADGFALLAFSLTTSVVLAACLTAAARLAG